MEHSSKSEKITNVKVGDYYSHNETSIVYIVLNFSTDRKTKGLILTFESMDQTENVLWSDTLENFVAEFSKVKIKTKSTNARFEMFFLKSNSAIIGEGICDVVRFDNKKIHNLKFKESLKILKDKIVVDDMLISYITPETTVIVENYKSNVKSSIYFNCYKN